MEQESAGKKRQYSEDFKQAVVAACLQPGMSIAEVARAHDLHPSLIGRWKRRQGISPRRPKAAEMRAVPGFVPVACSDLMSPVVSETRDIRVEIKRGNLAIRVAWPTASSPACAAWLQELLR